MGHDIRGLPLLRYIWFVLSLLLLFSNILRGTLALFSDRSFVIQLWLSFHDSGFKLH